MTTKAFTSALGYGITVRGYIDEEDKLVLLEPEGSGGGDFDTAELTVASEITPPITASIPAIVNNGGDGMIAIVNELASGVYTIPLYGDGCIITVSKSDQVEYTVSGDIELVTSAASVNIYRCYGDASITAESTDAAV